MLGQYLLRHLAAVLGALVAEPPTGRTKNAGIAVGEVDERMGMRASRSCYSQRTMMKENLVESPERFETEIAVAERAHAP